MKYKHALFINPYVETHSRSIMGLFPPTGLEYVATSAKDLVDRLTMLDLRYERSLCNIDNLLDFIKKENVDIICISISWDRQFQKICDMLNHFPDNIPLVVGGYKATEMIEELFKTCPKINIIARGEGEETIKEIMKGVPPENILGISYRKDGKVIHNEARPLPDVNTLSNPDRSLRRNKYTMRLNGVKTMSMTFDYVLGARGCPYTCKFCTFNLNPLGQKRNYAPRTIESIIREIEGITADGILFADDNFFVNAKRAEKICDLIIERKIKKRFIAQTRIEISKHPELLKKMVKAGFKILLMGIESPNDRILLQLNKGFTSDDVRKSFERLRKFPMYYHGYFIYGNITETEEEMMNIPKLAKEIGVDSIACSKLRIDKYSPLNDLAKGTPGYHVTDRGEVYSDAYSHPALKRIGKRMKFTFYTPARLIKISWKLIAIRLLTLRDIGSFIIASPLLLRNVIAREIEKGRLAESLKRIFISNK